MQTLLLVFLLGLMAVPVWAEEPVAPVAQPTPQMEDREIAVLQMLDKISARVTELRVEVGSDAAFGQLVATVRACKVAPPTSPPEAVAFIEISEMDINAIARNPKPEEMPFIPKKLLFSGWMFASSPALSALEHPVYDVVVLACENRNQPATEAPAQPAAPALPAEPEPPQD